MPCSLQNQASTLSKTHSHGQQPHDQGRSHVELLLQEEHRGVAGVVVNDHEEETLPTGPKTGGGRAAPAYARPALCSPRAPLLAVRRPCLPARCPPCYEPPYPDRTPPRSTLVPARHLPSRSTALLVARLLALPAMISLRGSGGSGGRSGGIRGSGGGGRSGSRGGAVPWGVSGGGQMQLQQRPRETLTPQQLCEWYASWSGRGGRSGGRGGAVQLVVDDYTSYTTVFPLRTKGEVPDVLIPWIRTIHLQLREQFRSDLPVLRLHSDGGGEFSSNLLRAFFHGEGILQSFTLPASPQQNGVAERRIGLVMEVARTSMIHAAAPHFLWSFATSLTLRWTGEVGDALVFRVSDSRAFVRDTSADKLSSRAVPCVFLDFPPDAPGWQFYHPTSRCVLSSQDVTFDKSVPFYRLFPYRTAPLPPLASLPRSRSLLTPPGDVAADDATDPRRSPRLETPPGFPPRPSSPPLQPVAVDSGAAGGGAARGAAPRGAEPEGAEPGGSEPESAEPGGAEPEGAEPGGAEPESADPGGAGATSPGGPLGVSPLRSRRREPLSPQQLREWYAWRTCLRSGVAGAGGPAAGGAGVGGAGVGGAGSGGTGARDAGAGGPAAGDAGAGGTRRVGAAVPGGARNGGTGVAGAGGAAGTGGAGLGGARTGGTGGALSPQQLHEWYTQRCRLRSTAARAGCTAAGDAGAGGTGGARGAGPGGACTGGTGAFGAGGAAGAGRASGSGTTGSGGACIGGPGATGAGGAAGSGAGGADAGDSGAGGAGATGGPGAAGPSTGGASAGGAAAGGSPLPAPSPYMEQTDSLTERREPASCPASPVRIVRSGRRVPRQRPPLVPGTHTMALRPSSVPQHVTLPSPLASSLPDVPEPESDLVRAASPTVTRLLATVVTGPSFESAAASALVAACRLDYAASLVAKSEFVCLPSVGGECALGTDVLEVRQEDIESLAAAIPQLTSMDAEKSSRKSTGTYVDAVPPLGANIVDGMWIFRLKWSPGSPPVFKARYVARGFSQQLGVDFFQTFSTITKMTTLQLPLHVSAQRDYGLHSLDFSTALLQGSVHEEIWLRRPPGFTGLFPPGSQWSLRRPVYGLRQAPRDGHDTLKKEYTCGSWKRHTCTDLGELRSYLGLQITRDRARRTITLTQSHMVQQVLQRFGFTWSSSQSTPLASGHSLSAPPSDESVEPTGPYSELVGCLMYLMTCTRPDLVYPLGLLARYVAPNRHRKVHWDAAKRVLRYLCSTSSMGLVLGGRGLVVLTGHSDASWVDGLATQQSSQGYTFSLGYGSISWRSTRSSSVLSSSCEAEIYAGAMAA
ncbi:unnamed protein product [Closterium sp. NIES-54]